VREIQDESSKDDDVFLKKIESIMVNEMASRGIYPTPHINKVFYAKWLDS